uniref:Uncharacterized protein n=1 Tax=Anguilla anguilla TaxID=7936 RepID=A0A0E9Q370_ANGAN
MYSNVEAVFNILVLLPLQSFYIFIHF